MVGVGYAYNSSDLVSAYSSEKCYASPAVAFTESECCEFTGGPFSFLPATPRGAGFFIAWLFLLLWIFAGVALGADIFMTSIEVITSKDKKVKIKVNGKDAVHHVKAWNPTIANLSLMAFGSSAPEILLSVIEILTSSQGLFFSGELGPSTIVGSAAFNLMVISAVCVACLPEGETRSIEQLSVFAVTASFSIFAYVWLLIILRATTPDVITLAEGILTLLFFFVLLGIAYVADVYPPKFLRSKILRTRGKKHGTDIIVGETAILTQDDIAAFVKEMERAEGGPVSAEEAMQRLNAELASAQPKSRAHYRAKTSAFATAKAKAAMGANEKPGTRTTAGLEMVNVKADGSNERRCYVGFELARTRVTEGDPGPLLLNVFRSGHLASTVKVRYATKEGTAKANSDYKPVEGVLTFEPDTIQKVVSVEIVDDDEIEQDETFEVVLSDVEVVDGGGVEVVPQIGGKGTHPVATVVIQDDDTLPGTLVWGNSKDENPGVYRITESAGEVTLTVNRIRGHNGTITVAYRTKGQSATPGKDYISIDGTLTFKHGELSKDLVVKILQDDIYEKEETFTVHLSDPTDGVVFTDTTDGGKEEAICTVKIISDDEVQRKVDKVLSKLMLDTQHIGLYAGTWREQMIEAVRFGDDEEEDEAGNPVPRAPFKGGPVAVTKRVIVYALMLPWKAFFALVPPPGLLSGWPCFVGALIGIAVQVVLIAEFATHMGCQVGLMKAVTAITFVALGTSLPDTFASKKATMDEKTADSSIGNVTGSNSVNVFMGLGLPWCMASIYWASQGQTPAWKAAYPDMVQKMADMGMEGQGGFVVRSGDLGFSVLVFTACALITLGILLLRRYVFVYTTPSGEKIPAELGGSKTLAYATAGVMTLLWVIYVVLASLSTYGHISVSI